MNPIEKFQSLLANIAHDLSLPFLTLNDNQTCHFMNENGVNHFIEVNETSGMFYLFADMGFLPEENQSEILSLLLEENNPSNGNMGINFFIDSTSQSIFLYYCCPISFLDELTLANIIDNFLIITTNRAEQLDQARSAKVLDDMPATNNVHLNTARKPNSETLSVTSMRKLQC